MLRTLIAKFKQTGLAADYKVGMKSKQKTARISKNITAARTIMERDSYKPDT